MTLVKFTLLNHRGESMQEDIEIDVDAVPSKDEYVDLFGRGGVVQLVSHRYSASTRRGGAVEKQITVTITAN
jgi:hypothetical protein